MGCGGRGLWRAWARLLRRRTLRGCARNVALAAISMLRCGTGDTGFCPLGTPDYEWPWTECFASIFSYSSEDLPQTGKPGASSTVIGIHYEAAVIVEKRGERLAEAIIIYP